MYKDIEFEQIQSPISNDYIFIYRIPSQNVAIKVERRFELYYAEIQFETFDDEFNSLRTKHCLLFPTLDELKLGLPVFLEKHIDAKFVIKLTFVFPQMYEFFEYNERCW